jgi:hypothetical protein
MHRPHRQRLTAVAREQCLEVHAALIAAALITQFARAHNGRSHVDPREPRERRLPDKPYRARYHDSPGSHPGNHGPKIWPWAVGLR